MKSLWTVSLVNEMKLKKNDILMRVHPELRNLIIDIQAKNKKKGNPTTQISITRKIARVYRSAVSRKRKRRQDAYSVLGF